MPAAQFFLMLEAGRRQHSHEMRELCYVQAISICDSRYFEQLRDSYSTEDGLKIGKKNTMDFSDDPEGARSMLMAIFADRTRHDGGRNRQV